MPVAADPEQLLPFHRFRRSFASSVLCQGCVSALTPPPYSPADVGIRQVSDTLPSQVSDTLSDQGVKKLILQRLYVSSARACRSGQEMHMHIAVSLP